MSTEVLARLPPLERRKLLIWTPGLWRWVPADTFERLSRRLESAKHEGPPRDLRLTRTPRAWLSDTLNELGKRLWRRGSGKELWHHSMPILTSWIPILGSVQNRGWRLDLIRRSADHDLPEWRNAGLHLADGAILWAYYLLYLLPLYFFLSAAGFDWLDTILALIWWFIKTLASGSADPPLAAVIASAGWRFFFESVAVTLISMCTWPIYRVGTLRYAVEDDHRVFLDLRRNTQLALRHRMAWLRIYGFEKVLWTVFLGISALLGGTIVGVIAIPSVLNPLRLLLSGFLYEKAADNLLPWSDLFPR